MRRRTPKRLAEARTLLALSSGYLAGIDALQRGKPLREAWRVVRRQLLEVSEDVEPPGIMLDYLRDLERNTCAHAVPHMWRAESYRLDELAQRKIDSSMSRRQ